MITKEENRKAGAPPPVDKSALEPGDEEECGNKPEREKQEIQELQAEDPGNQGA